MSHKEYKFDNDKKTLEAINLKTGKYSTSKKIVGGVKMAPTWMNDSTIVYTHRSDPDLNGSKFFDLYRININHEDAEPDDENYAISIELIHQWKKVGVAFFFVEGELGKRASQYIIGDVFYSKEELDNYTSLGGWDVILRT